MSKQNSRASRRQRLGQARKAEQRRKRRIRVAAIGGGAVIAVAAIAVGVTLAVSGGSSGTPAGYAPLSTLGALQTLFHIHVHLTIFVNGAARQIPAAIGIPGAVAQQTQSGPFIGSGTCFYWLHTHAADGIVHIESPVQRTYTLGQFFDEWGQPLGTDVVGPEHGHVTVIVNGKVFTGNPRDVPLTKHAEIQLEVGTPLVAPESISWATTGL